MCLCGIYPAICFLSTPFLFLLLSFVPIPISILLCFNKRVNTVPAEKKPAAKAKFFSIFAFCGWFFFYLSVAIQTPILILLTLHPNLASYFFSTNSALFSVVLSLPMKTSKAPFSLSTRSFSVRKRSSSSVILKMTSVSSPG